MLRKSLLAVAVLAGIFPLIALADYSPLALSPTTTVNPLPLLCFDFKSNLKQGASGDQVRRLQFFLLDSGYSISPIEYGEFDTDTSAAVKAFQEKYKDEILTPNGLTEGTGFVGKATRAKINSLYGCDIIAKQIGINGVNVKLNVTSISLDSNGVNVTFCNRGQDIPTFPVRVRLNGVIRDFDILGAKKAGSCDTETFTYGTWGLTYDPGSTYTVVTALDPLGIYKAGQLQYSLGTGAQLKVPAISGAHLAVRSLLLMSSGVQGTFCNQGTADLTSFPLRITVNNSTTKDFDVAEVHMKATCKNKLFNWNDLGVSYASGTVYNVTATVDPNNVINEVNEFDNAATVIGTP